MARKIKKRMKNKDVSRNSKLIAKKSTGNKYYFWLFINALLIAVFIFGIYKMWMYDWVQGISIIVFDLLVILLIKLVLKLRRK